MIKAKFTKTALSIALGLCAVAVPGYCTNLTLSLNNTTAPDGTISNTGGTSNNGFSAGSYITDFVDPLSSLVVSGAATAANGTYGASGTNLELIYEGGSQQTTSANVVSGESTAATASSGYLYLVLLGSLTGSGNLTGLSANQILVSWSVSGIDWTSSTASTPFYTTNNFHVPTITLNTATTLSESVSLLDDLYTPATFPAGTIIPDAFLGGSNVIGTGSATTSNNVNTFSEASSPVSFVLTPEPVSILMLGSGLLTIAFFGRKRLIAR